MTTTDFEKALAVKQYARHTVGSECLHRHPMLIQFHHTDGIQFMAETCGAHWLIDAVMSWQPEVQGKLSSEGFRDFQVWRFARDYKRDEAWILECWSDTPSKSTLLASQKIEYSDFPQGLAPFEFYVENFTMMLKEER